MRRDETAREMGAGLVACGPAPQLLVKLWGFALQETNMYTVANFGCSDTRALASCLMPNTRCRDGLRAWWEGKCDAITLTDPSDRSLILSLDTCDRAPDVGMPPPTKLVDNINEAAESLAAVALLGKHLPQGEGRRDALQALAGVLLRDGNEMADTEEWVLLVARAADDPLWETYAPLVRATNNRLRSNKPVAGVPRLQELVGANVADAALRWAGVERRAGRAGKTDDLDFRCAQYLMDDIGNAERFVARYGDRVRYCHDWGCWLVWTTEVWARDTDGQIMRWARDTVRAILREAASLPVVLDAQGKDSNQAARDALARHASTSATHRRLSAMTTLASANEGVAILAAQLDPSRWLFNTLNGTLDLRTGRLAPHRREDLLTKQAPVAFDTDATCPVWESFLARVLPDAEVRAYVQRIAGYTLTAETREQCLFFLFGGGRNGKSTFMETVIGMVGPYSAKTRSETLMVKRGSGVPNDVAALCGARLVSVAEIGEGQRLDEALVKDLVGQDTMQARFLFKEFFSFVPSHKLWLYGNHKPAIRGTDMGIWRRIKLIPFEVTIPDADVDSELPVKLRAELPGILNWALVGCQKWQVEGLGEPEAVKQAVREYRSEMDTLSQFLQECCTVGSRYEVKRSDLYAAYKTWCQETGEYQVTSTKFALRLKERGIKDRKYGTYLWCGIGLLSAHIPTVAPLPLEITATDEGAGNLKELEEPDWHYGI